jgi:hypothetical protein
VLLPHSIWNVTLEVHCQNTLILVLSPVKIKVGPFVRMTALQVVATEVFVAVGMAVFVVVAMGVFVAVLTGVFVAVAMGVFVAVAIGMSVAVAMGVFVAVAMGVLVAVITGVFVVVVTGVFVAVGCVVGTLVSVAVKVGTGVEVGPPDPPVVTTSCGAFAPASREPRLVLVSLVLSIARLMVPAALTKLVMSTVTQTPALNAAELLITAPTAGEFV